MTDELTHFDADGAARMVSIADKDETPRTAVARARVRMREATLVRIEAGQIAKGDVLQIARIAGIAAAKSTATAIPLCHPVRLTGVDLAFTALPDRTTIEIRAEVHAIDRDMTIEAVALLEKTGGKSGHFVREP